MPKYLLTNAADEDLAELYSYSFIEFGERRGDAYFESLDDCLQLLAGNPQLGVSVTRLRRKYLRYVHERHTIYYKKSRREILLSKFLAQVCLQNEICRDHADLEKVTNIGDTLSTT